MVLSNEEKDIIQSKIAYWLDNIENQFPSVHQRNQKQREIIFFGQFMHCFNKNIKIINAYCEQPDIHISLDNKEIGIEIRELPIRNEEREREGIIQTIFTQVEEELKLESDKYNGLYAIRLNDSINFKEKGKIEMTNEIKELIRTNMLCGKFVTMIEKSFHKSIHIYTSNPFVVGPLTRSTVAKAISKKESKIKDYSSENYNEMWLLLITEGIQASDNYSFIHKDVTKSPFKTSFEKVFLMNYFERSIIELKTTPYDTI